MINIFLRQNQQQQQKKHHPIIIKKMSRDSSRESKHKTKTNAKQNNKKSLQTSRNESSNQTQTTKPQPKHTNQLTTVATQQDLPLSGLKKIVIISLRRKSTTRFKQSHPHQL